jgi:CheY-like chemotaxis protein
MSNAADLMRGAADLLWVVVAFGAVFVVRKLLITRGGSLTRFGVGPSGVTMEFAEAKLDEAVRGSDEQTQRAVGQAAKRSVIDRLQRNADLLGRARILWADDHPENNTPVVELLRRFGASVETPRSNAEALALLRASRYDVVISDVARDNEGPGSDLKGLELAEQVFTGWGLRILLFTARFDPANMPGISAQERLSLVQLCEKYVFARTNRMDEALHYILDLLER